MQANSFIPNDLELVIPGNFTFFQFLLVISFLIHIVFVNMMLASSVMAVSTETIGLVKKNKIYDRLAFQLATQTSVFKSIAVVLGVAPLLLISVNYTQFIYPSTILIGKAWLSLIIVLIVAFLSLYVYKFSWHRWKNRRALHLSFGIFGALLLLFVPLIFIVNVVSMLYPEMWQGAKGFFHSLIYYPQIWQRYAHFVLSSFGAMGLFMYLWNRRQWNKVILAENGEKVEDREQRVFALGKKIGIAIAFWTTILQFVAGSLVLMSLEQEKMMLYMGGDAFLTGLLASSIFVTFLLALFLYLAMKTDVTRWLYLAIASFVIVVGLMGWMRHEVREVYVKPHRELNPPTVSVNVSYENDYLEKE